PYDFSRVQTFSSGFSPFVTCDSETIGDLQVRTQNRYIALFADGIVRQENSCPDDPNPGGPVRIRREWVLTGVSRTRWVARQAGVFGGARKSANRAAECDVARRGVGLAALVLHTLQLQRSFR